LRRHIAYLRRTAMSIHSSKAGRLLVGAAAVSTASFLLAACSGGSGYGSSSGAGNNAKNTGAMGTVKTAKTSAGTVLVDSAGRTLYAFSADSPGTSNCTRSCASYWPPASASGRVSHTSDVTATLSTISRADGTTQLTVNGWPVYTYVGDSKAGQASGQGKNLSGGLWWVLAPSGSQIKTSGGGDTDGY
jgi:predicted lipoprotein with Yx(FWY)xxD motif